MEHKMGENNQINIIYDSRNSDDYGRLIEQFIGQSVVPKYKIWDCIRYDDSVVKSINASHKMIVRWAKENNMNRVVIAEQDIEFTHPTAWEYFLKNVPDKFGIYLACSYIKNAVPNSDVVNNLICGFHLYILDSSCYDAFLSVPDDQHIDVAVGGLGLDVKFCKPFPALQRSGFSANNKTIVNYNAILKEEEIYRG